MVSICDQLVSFVHVAASSTKRRQAPSGNSEREPKSRKTDDGNQTSAPGQRHGPNASRAGGSASGGAAGQPPPGYSGQGGSVSVGGHTISLDEVYGQRHGQKREDYVDQRLMDELKKGRVFVFRLRTYFLM